MLNYYYIYILNTKEVKYIMKKYLDSLPNNAKQIKGALAWCTPDGKIYGQETRKVPNR